MFCYQCEQTQRDNGNLGCTIAGNCGKNEQISNLQDLLIFSLLGVAPYALECRKLGIETAAIDEFVAKGLFATLTNVNFDPQRLKAYIRQALIYREDLKTQYQAYCIETQTVAKSFEANAAMTFNLINSDLAIQVQADSGVAGFDNLFLTLGEDVTGLFGLILFGLKGIAAYTDHAFELGYINQAIYTRIYECLVFLAEQSSDAGQYLDWATKLGETNYWALELLDKASTESYGHPIPTQARITPVQGKAILVSGHGLNDLKDLLDQTVGTGISIYTHGEMLPALAYPELKKYPHLIGNFGGGWQDQQKDFSEFPGAILMTTNCLIAPQAAYSQRIFTMGTVGWPNTSHISDRNFGPLIAAAQREQGFSTTPEAQSIPIGFARNTVLGVADKVIDAVKSGTIKHFFLIGGCDGANSGRNYFTDFALSVPEDSVVLTLACGKYRFNKHDFGSIAGLPRILDMGQCNDSYSAVQVAVALAKAFDCGVNDLPLSFIISWFEQKAVAVLLSLLYLGIQNIHLGPTLPAFLTPSSLAILVEKFKIRPTTTAAEDLARILNK
jgi:hydroxylamine reductase